MARPDKGLSRVSAWILSRAPPWQHGHMSTSSPLHLRLVLCRPQGPINIGMIMRLCGNVGLDDLQLVDPLCDHCGDEARKFANHRREDLAHLPVHAELSAAIADCDLAIGTSARERDERWGGPISLPALWPAIQERGSQRVALVFGNEAHGLNREELAQCHLLLHLDTWGDYSSYNLANAVAIIGHHLASHLHTPSEQSSSSQALPADIALVQRLGSYWLDSLERFAYFRGNRRRDLYEPHFRQMLQRLALSKDDATTLFASLAQFNYHTFGDKGPQHSDTEH